VRLRHRAVAAELIRYEVRLLLSERIARARALLDYGADADTVLRAKGWAVLFAVMLLDTGIPGSSTTRCNRLTAVRQLQEDHG
jgi:hypothetical protein